MSTDVWWVSTLVAGTAILALGYGGALALRRSSAWENALWRTVLLLILALPIVTAGSEWVPVPRWQQTRWIEQIHRRAIDLAAVSEPPSSHVDAEDSAVPQPAASPADRSNRVPLRSLLFWGWGTGLMWSLGRMALGIVRVRRLLRASRPLVSDESLRSLEACARVAEVSCPGLHISDNLSGPLLVGWWQPCILVPAGDDPPGREVLLHEMAHLKRADLWWMTLGRVAGALWWFHPLVWRMTRRLERSAEEVCDDLVLSWTHDATAYAAQLLSFTRQAQGRRPAFSGVAVTGFHSGLGKRIVRLLVPGRTLRVSIGRGGLGALGVGAALTLALLVAVLPGRSQSVPPPHEETTLPPDITVQGTIIALPKDQAAQFLAQHHLDADAGTGFGDLQTLVAEKKAVSAANPAFSMKNHFRCSSESGTTRLEVESHLTPDGTKIDADVIFDYGTSIKINAWITVKSGDVKFLGSFDAREPEKNVTYFAFVRLSPSH